MSIEFIKIIINTPNVVKGYDRFTDSAIFRLSLFPVQSAKQPDLFRMPVKFVGCLEHKQQMPEPWGINYVCYRIQTDTAMSDFLMPVLMACVRVPAVIEVNRVKPVEPYDPVKFSNDKIKVIYDIITRVVHMAGIKANAQLVAQRDFVDDPS